MMRCRAKYFPPWLSVWLRKDAVPWVTCRTHIFSTFTLKVKALLHLVTKKHKWQEIVARKMLFQSTSQSEPQPRNGTRTYSLPFGVEITLLCGMCDFEGASGELAELLDKGGAFSVLGAESGHQCLSQHPGSGELCQLPDAACNLGIFLAIAGL